jgi:hypothetical protein
LASNGGGVMRQIFLRLDLLLEAQLVIFFALLKCDISSFQTWSQFGVFIKRQSLVFKSVNVGNILQLLNVRLQLFQQHQTQSNQRLRVDVCHVFSLLNLVDVKVNVVLSLQNCRVLLHKVLNKLSQKQNRFRVAGADFDELVEEL